MESVTNAVPEEVKYVSVGITVGRRFELVPLVTARLQKLVPDRQPYIISMTAGEAQSRNKRPSYLIFLPCQLAEKDGVPTSVACNACRAFAWEKLRLRCTDSTCKLRSVPVALVDPATDQEKKADLNEEFPSEDLEGREQGEDEQVISETVEDDDVEVDKAPKKTKEEKELAREYKVDVWLFANSIDHYDKLLTVFQCTQASWANRPSCSGDFLPEAVPGGNLFGSAMASSLVYCSELVAMLQSPLCFLTYLVCCRVLLPLLR